MLLEVPPPLLDACQGAKRQPPLQDVADEDKDESRGSLLTQAVTGVHTLLYETLLLMTAPFHDGDSALPPPPPPPPLVIGACTRELLADGERRVMDSKAGKGPAPPAAPAAPSARYAPAPAPAS